MLAPGWKYAHRIFQFFVARTHSLRPNVKQSLDFFYREVRDKTFIKNETLHARRKQKRKRTTAHSELKQRKKILFRKYSQNLTWKNALRFIIPIRSNVGGLRCPKPLVFSVHIYLFIPFLLCVGVQGYIFASGWKCAPFFIEFSNF